jgi:hypothetical protein
MKLKVLIPAILFALMIACSPSTKLVNTWLDPSLTPATVQPFKNVLVIARIKDETSNRVAEDKIVAKLKVPASPSYAFLLPSDTNTVAVDEKLKKAGFDGLVAMRLTDVNQTLNYQQGSGGYYGGYYGGRPGGYYGYYGTPGYYTEDRTFYVETSIFSLVTGKLMWSGTTSSLNPTQLDQTLDEIIYAIRTELTKKGLIKE